MTIYSRYLLSHFLRLFGLIIGTSLAFSLVCRMEEIALFATLGVPGRQLFQFTLMQLPFFFPLVAPMGTLMAAWLLMRRFSRRCELTALRVGGLSLKQILSPILIASIFISLCTFYLISEVATYAHRRSREMVVEVTRINPLVMLEHPSMTQLTGAYVRMNPLHHGNEVSNVILALPGKRLTLALVDHLKIKEGELQGSAASCITNLPNEEGFDHVVLENLQATHSPAVELASLLRQKGWRLAHDHLSWRLLKARQAALRGQTDGKSRIWLIECSGEKMRRLSLGLMPLTFALLGACYGMEIGRTPSKRGLFTLIILAVLAMISLIVGKELDHRLFLAFPLFWGPHLILIACAFWKLRQIEAGR